MHTAYLALRVPDCLLSKFCHMFNYRGKVSGSPQLNESEGLVVGLHHSLHPQAVRVGRVAIESKLVRDYVTQLTTKAKSGEVLVTEGREKWRVCIYCIIRIPDCEMKCFCTA